MKNLKSALPGLLMVWLVCLAMSTAQAGAIDHLRNFSTQARTAQGNFTQRVVTADQRLLEASSGEFVFARPGKFRWIYLKPFEQVLVADGAKLTMYDKDLNQVTIRKLSDALSTTPAAILFGGGDLEKTFALKEAGLKDGIEWLEATPRSKDTTFERIGIGFRNGQLAAMELRDALGQVTLLTFAAVRINPQVPPSTFSFVPPSGADVLSD